MTEQRSAAEIRAYCEAWDNPVRQLGIALRESLSQKTSFAEKAFVDLPRALDAADESWGMVAHLYHAGATADMDPDTVAEVERILDDYEWLAEPLSASVESGGGSET